MRPNDSCRPAVRIGVDVGGTFTDVALLEGGALTAVKVPTTADQSRGVIEGIETAGEVASIDPARITDFGHATTVSVNALLERAGAPTALVTTAGFRDVLEIARQDRPSLYDLSAEKPEPLVPRRRRFEIDERASVDGIDVAVDPDDVVEIANTIEESDADSVAVCLLHAYAHPENERVVAEGLRRALDIPVSVSHEVLAEFREYERTATTTADAYVKPVIRGYLETLLERVTDYGLPKPRIMQGTGGTADVSTVRNRPVTTTMSGPAAGVVGAAATVDADNLITFDMGGTSTDVSLIRNGSVERTTDATVGDVPIRTPMVDVVTVGAGGGSIAWVDDGGALRVGPDSAGATPGPACYDRGGTDATVTDASVVLGYIGPETALGGDLTLDVDAATSALEELATEAGLADARSAASGVYRIATETMARAIRSVTVERGHDPRQCTLVAYGGAGPMHATALAESLEIDRIVVPLSAGILSAYGLLAADETHDAVRTITQPLAEVDPHDVEETFVSLETRVREDVSDPTAVSIDRSGDCRYVGQSFELEVPIDSIDDRDATGDDRVTDASFDPHAVGETFHGAHETAYGYRLDEAIELVSLRVRAVIERETPAIQYEPTTDGGTDSATRTAHFPGQATETTVVYDRRSLAVESTFDGPAILEQDESTTVVAPGWAGTVREDGAIVLERTNGRDGGAKSNINANANANTNVNPTDGDNQ